jgi:hypothetical protein
MSARYALAFALQLRKKHGKTSILMYAAVTSGTEPPDHACGENETPPEYIQFLVSEIGFLLLVCMMFCTV